MSLGFLIESSTCSNNVAELPLLTFYSVISLLLFFTDEKMLCRVVQYIGAFFFIYAKTNQAVWMGAYPKLAVITFIMRSACEPSSLDGCLSKTSSYNFYYEISL